MKPVTPMLLQNGSLQHLVKKDFIYETKLDGIRALYHKEGGSVKIINRKEKDITAKYPDLVRPKSIKAANCVLDGEIVVYNEAGKPDFHLLMKRDQLKSFDAIFDATDKLPAVFIAFDILEKDGIDLRTLPLVERKAILAEVVAASEHMQLMDYTTDGIGLWDTVVGRQLEGVVAKKADTPYSAGKRTDYWLKIKNFKTQDCIITGYSQNNRVISALALAAYDQGRLRFLGKVGTGFTMRQLDEMYDLISKEEIEKPKLEVPSHYKNIHWIKPKYACEVQYVEFGADGIFRSPSFLRMRPDKPLKDCIIDLPVFHKLEGRFAVRA
jgi:bifunctional non-homologous end joining protein LigD